MESSQDSDTEENLQNEEEDKGEESTEDKKTKKKVDKIPDEHPQLGLLERPVIESEKQKSEGLEMYVETQNNKNQIHIPEGSGQKLEDNPRVEHQLNRVKAEDLKIIHQALFDQQASPLDIKKNIRKFNGFDFGKDDKRFEKKRAQLFKNTTVILKKMCEILDLERSGSKEDILNRLMDFLLEPKSSGKIVPKGKQKRKSSNVTAKSKAKKTKEKKTFDLSDSSYSDEDNDSISVRSEESKESEEESVGIMPTWSTEQRVFAYDTYVKTGESVIKTQRLFRKRFNIGRHGNIPSRNTILRWVNALRTTGSILKTKPPGPAKTARTPGNVDRLREAILQSPTRSARQHSAELGISQSTVQRIIHKDLACVYDTMSG